MKKVLLICLFSFIFCGSAYAAHSCYGNVSTTGTFPNEDHWAGGSYRYHRGNHGMELSGQRGTEHHGRAKALYLLYPARRGFYVGAGSGATYGPRTQPQLDGSLEGAVGYEWRTTFGARMYAELNVSTLHKDSVGFSLGIGF